MSSTLYRFGSSTAQTVDVTADDSRDLGDVDVKSLSGAIDVADRSNRNLGNVTIDNDPGISGTVAVDLSAQSLANLATDLAVALASNGGDHLLFQEQNPMDVSAAPLGVTDSTGTQVDPATLASVEAVATELQNRLANRANLAFGRDSVSTSGTPVALNGGTAQAVPDQQAVAVQAVPGNAGSVYVGDSTVTTTSGYPLQAGQVVTLGMDDVSTIHVDADNAGDSVAWIVEVA